MAFLVIGKPLPHKSEFCRGTKKAAPVSRGGLNQRCESKDPRGNLGATGLAIAEGDEGREAHEAEDQRAGFGYGLIREARGAYGEAVPVFIIRRLPADGGVAAFELNGAVAFIADDAVRPEL